LGVLVVIPQSKKLSVSSSCGNSDTFMKTHYVQDASAFRWALEQIEGEKRLAIDLEFDKNRYAYGFNLCLMQIATTDHCFLIDPLGKLEIAKIFPVLENPEVELVAYSFDEDMRLLHSLGCQPTNIFDTATAFTLLDYAPTSLGNALVTLLGVELEKSKQTSNWMKRPLSQKQLDYAANDVLHLFDFQDEIIKQAKEDGIEGWIAEENAYLETLDYSDIEGNVFLKDKDRRLLTPYEWHIFEALMTRREAAAEALGKPSYQVIDKDFLMKLAQDPANIKEFHKIPQLHRSLRNAAFRKELESITKNANEEAKQKDLPKSGNAIKKMPREKYLLLREEKKRIEQAKQQVFQPIQEQLQADYGEHTMRLILNNKLIGELVIGDTSRLLDYKRRLLEAYAKELKLDLRAFYE
jgi:ribonuclease D